MIVEDYFYDTEFHEMGPRGPIDAISLGAKRRRDGRPFYAIFQDFDMHAAWFKKEVNGEYWLRENVLKKLPLIKRDNGELWLDGDDTPMLDDRDLAVKSRQHIKAELAEFLQLGNPNIKRRVWAWYADYDHVVLSQIWGKMSELPEGMPMFTHDLKQVVDMAGNPAMPKQQGDAHNALDDAQHLQEMFNYCVDLGLLQQLPVSIPKTHIKSRPILDNPQA